MNAIITAYKTMTDIINTVTAGNKSTDDLRAELNKLTKHELIDKLLLTMKTTKVTIEAIAQPILESEECAWLTYEDIAEAIVRCVGSNTSKKSIADYASKRPTWNVVPRKTQSQRLALLKL